MTDDEDWTTHAACAVDPEWFDAAYHPRAGTGQQKVHAGIVAECIRICRRCPVRQQCHDYAVEVIAYGPNSHGPRHGCAGVWAGVDYGARNITDANDETEQAS